MNDIVKKILSPTFKTMAIHLSIFAAINTILIVFTVTFNDAAGLIIGILASSLDLFYFLYISALLVRLLIIEYKKIDSDNSFFKDCIFDGKVRRISVACIGTILSLSFAILHIFLSVFYVSWFYGLSALFYIIGLSVRLLIIYIDETDNKDDDNAHLFITSFSIIILSIFFFFIVLYGHKIRESFAEPPYLLGLEIFFFTVKFVAAIISFVISVKEKNDLLISHAVLTYTLAIFTGFGAFVSILHELEMMSTYLLIIVGSILSFSILVIGIVVLMYKIGLMKNNDAKTK